MNKILYLAFRIVGYQKFTSITRPLVRILNFLGISIINENDDYNFKPEILPSRGIKFYVGGWHSEKYFIEMKEDIKNAFEFNLQSIGKENLQVLEVITGSNSVSVHVRRGDFMDSNNYGKLGGVCTLNYFLIAIQKMSSLVDNPHFFFFTDDNSWVSANFNGPNMTIININRDCYK